MTRPPVDGGPPGSGAAADDSAGTNSGVDWLPGSRGQAHTLEGVVASLILLSAVVFALEMTAVTPLSASTSSQHIENQQEATARGILGSAADSGALKRAVLYWNETGDEFHDALRRGYYASNPPANDFGAMLDRSFGDSGIAYNVYFRYATGDDSRERTEYVYQGRPSDNAVRATWPVTLYDDAALRNDDGSADATETVTSESEFYAPPVSGSSVYNVVRVEVIVWRI